MSDTQLIQKSGTTHKVITLMSDHIHLQTKNMQEELEYRIRFEELGAEIVKKKQKAANLPFLLFLPFCALNLGLLIDSLIDYQGVAMPIFWAVCLLIFGVLAVYSFGQRNKSMIYLTGGSKVLELIGNKPDADTVNRFISSIDEAKRSYYRTRYLQLSDDATYEDRIATYKWLLSIDAITLAEYTELIQDAKLDRIIGPKWWNEEK